MGVDLRYLGLPAGCGFIDLVRSRPWTDPTLVGEVRGWLSWGTSVHGELIKPQPGQALPWSDDPEAELLWGWCCDAVQRFPDIGQRSLDVHKSYRWFPFILSAKARNHRRWPKPAATDPRSWNDPEGEFDQLVEQVFHGSPQIAPGVTGMQGLPIRLMMQSVVNNFGLCVGAMEPDEIAAHVKEAVAFDLIAAWDLELRTTEFLEFQRFFAEAAKRGEDVLVIWD